MPASLRLHHQLRAACTALRLQFRLAVSLSAAAAPLLQRHDGWRPQRLQSRLPVSHPPGGAPQRAHIATMTLTSLPKKKIATLTVRLTPTSLSSPIPTPNASRCHRAPLLLVYEGPLRWYRPCTTFQKISTAHQVPLDNETTHQVPSVVPLGRTFVSVSCTMSRALAKTRHAPELRSATLAKTRHDPIADTRALVSGTVINYLYLYFGVLLISFNTIHSILRMVYVR